MSDGVMVFAPAPVLTVTVEQHDGVADLHIHPGGQGVWQARMLTSLGCSVTLCVTVGGESGQLLGKLLADEDVTLRVVERNVSSGWYVHDRRDGQRDEVAEHPGAPLVRHDIDELYNIALVEGLRARISVLSGPADPSVIDADVYRRLAKDIASNGGQVVVDLTGDYLDAVLTAGVALVKISHEELLASGRAADDRVETLIAAGRALLAGGAAAVLISRAELPALALFEDRVEQVISPQLEVNDHRGAGDSMTAGAVAVLSRGGTMEEAIRTGAAAGALNVTRHGLGTGSAEAVQELLTRVHLEPVEPTAGRS